MERTARTSLTSHITHVHVFRCLIAMSRTGAISERQKACVQAREIARAERDGAHARVGARARVRAHGAVFTCPPPCIQVYMHWWHAHACEHASIHE
eukprot:6200187-Pleurochrysis_carterae.AAC.2